LTVIPDAATAVIVRDPLSKGPIVDRPFAFFHDALALAVSA